MRPPIARLVFACLFPIALTTTLTAQSPIIGIWQFDETTGTTLNDLGPYANHGTLVSFPTPEPWVPGQLGNSLQFDGVDDYVDIAWNGGFPFYTSNGEAFTISIWVNGSPTDDDRFLSLSSSTASNPLLTLGTGRTSTGNTDKLQVFRRSDSSGGYPNRYTVATVFDNTWHHVAFVEHSGFARVYVDGVPDIAFPIDTGTRFVTADILTLGSILRPASASPVCCSFTGQLDDLHIYTFPLNQADITLVMAGAIAPTRRASLSTFGTGCAGPSSYGLFSLVAFGGPLIGGQVEFRVTGGTPGATPVLLFQFGLPGNLDLQPFGASPGCTLYASSGSAVSTLPPLDPFGSSSAGLPLGVPNVAALAGLNLTFQALDYAPVIASNAVLTILGM